LWVPSQNGLSSVLLHPQRLKVPELSATNRSGWKLVVLWEPSQNGCLAERPGAPEIGFSGLEGHLVGALLGADGLVGHGSLP